MSLPRHALLFALVLSPCAATARPLPAEQEFSLSASRTSDGKIVLQWMIAPDAHLYRNRTAVAAGDRRPVPFAADPEQTEDDPVFGPEEVCHGTARATVAAKDLPPSGDLVVSDQGCSDRGICYPPMTSHIDPAMLAVTRGSARLDLEGRVAAPTSPPPGTIAFPLAATPLWTFATFVSLGLLLAFSPCTFPMLPVVAGLLTGAGGRSSATRGLFLSGSYVLASASAYAATGIAAAWSGESLQAALQWPAVLMATAALYVALALSLLGFFDLKMPATGLDRLAGYLPARYGTALGAGALGFVSALVAGPCVTPPLAAALLYVTHTGDPVRGASALFALGLGMGVPLIVVGTFGASLLPRSGPWLVTVRHGSGVVLLALAVGMAGRMVPGSVTLALWGLLAVGVGIFFGGFGAPSRTTVVPSRLSKSAGGSVVAYGLALLTGAACGANDPLRPLTFLPERAEASAAMHAAAEVAAVRSPEALDAALTQARAAGRVVVVAFSAAWCTACQAFDRAILADPGVRASLASTTFVRADVTHPDADAQALMQRFEVVGSPTVVFLSGDVGKEIPGTRLVGEPSRDDFGRALDCVGLPSHATIDRGINPINRRDLWRTLLAGAVGTAVLPLFKPATGLNEGIDVNEILNDPDAPVAGNPRGDVTIVAFLDYNYPFFERSAPDLEKPLSADRGIRLVYKDWPILKPASVYGAKMALAAKYQGRYDAACGFDCDPRSSHPGRMDA